MTDLTQLIATHRAQLLAELAICEAATVGPWRNNDTGAANVLCFPDQDRRDLPHFDGRLYVHTINRQNDTAFIATARNTLPDRIRENLRMLDALSMIYEQSCPDCGAYAYAESALRDILRPKEG